MDKENIKVDDIETVISSMIDDLVPVINKLFNIIKKVIIKKKYYFKKKSKKYKRFERRNFYGKTKKYLER